MCLSIGEQKYRRCLTMMSEEEIDWIENRIAELLEKLVATSEDKYAVEIRGLLNILDGKEGDR